MNKLLLSGFLVLLAGGAFGQATSTIGTPVPTASGGLGVSAGASSGIPCLASGTTTIYNTTGAVSNNAGTCSQAAVSNLSDGATATLTITDGSAGTLTFTTPLGKTTRIGNMVIGQTSLTYPSTVSAAANVINGLSPAAAGTKVGTGTCVTGGGVGYDLLVASGGTSYSMFTSAGVQVLNSSLSTVLVYCTFIYSAS